MKAQYRRPTAIPFPADNPYTPEAALLEGADAGSRKSTMRSGLGHLALMLMRY